MIFTIETQSDRPIYQQLRAQIIVAIAKGELMPGELLPSVRQLASEIGINTMTISKAYNSLKEEGLLITDRRKGTIVATPQLLTEKESTQYLQDLEVQLAAALVHGKTKATLEQEFHQVLAQFTEGCDIK
ncbi:hypothetical protein A5886_000596 [Enterococcus sp. 8G7_MSG3316]|uniref:HTH gntR-type domain-containing protein n=1 Tax=Candidatus Enterococcus testudinis TaxID=1834191 RepID=A0A242A3J5_9ENTE|nr:GntR family transcriptional regulator [Enterococcus sp. 8G7_MSG3316]OTN75522.1 hypothetical protein A5886_000596 [Enterococcus sp. 8G7_MSG3316]